MTAQQQLAELLQQTEEGVFISLSEFGQFVDFIRDHGPAIAELIEAAKMSIAASKSMDATGLERSRAQYALEYHLRKLTQEA